MPQIFVDWLQQTALGKQNNLRLNSSGDKGGRTPDAGTGESRERSGGEVDATTGEAGEELDGFNDDDTPLTWAEVGVLQYSSRTILTLIAARKPKRKRTKKISHCSSADIFRVC